MSASGPILYPNVSSLSGQIGRVDGERGTPAGREKVAPGEFDQVFKKALTGEEFKRDLSQLREPLKFSAHASQRLNDRKIALDPAMMEKLNVALDKAEAKGIEDTLVLTDNAAFIVNVKNRTVVTALDRNSLNGNV